MTQGDSSIAGRVDPIVLLRQAIFAQPCNTAHFTRPNFGVGGDGTPFLFQTTNQILTKVQFASGRIRLNWNVLSHTVAV